MFQLLVKCLLDVVHKAYHPSFIKNIEIWCVAIVNYKWKCLPCSHSDPELTLINVLFDVNVHWLGHSRDQFLCWLLLPVSSVQLFWFKHGVSSLSGTVLAHTCQVSEFTLLTLFLESVGGVWALNYVNPPIIWPVSPVSVCPHSSAMWLLNSPL